MGIVDALARPAVSMYGGALAVVVLSILLVLASARVITQVAVHGEIAADLYAAALAGVRAALGVAGWAPTESRPRPEPGPSAPIVLVPSPARVLRVRTARSSVVRAAS